MYCQYYQVLCAGEDSILSVAYSDYPPGGAAEVSIRLASEASSVIIENCIKGSVRAASIAGMIERWSPNIWRNVPTHCARLWSVSEPTTHSSDGAEHSPSTYEAAVRSRPRVSLLVAPLLALHEPSEPLLPHQLTGVQWLLRKRRALLADDMGLGKTLQVISAMRKLVWEGLGSCFLVVCPGSLLSTWSRELEKWGPELTVMRCTPPSTTSHAVWDALVGRTHVVLTSYSHLRSNRHLVAKRRWDLVVLDEAHKVRRPESAVTKAVMSLESERLWALTGTPIENNVDDLATLLSVIDGDRQSGIGASSGLLVRASARQYVLRRTKADVLPDLPIVHDSRVSCPLLGWQRRSYDELKSVVHHSEEPGERLARFARLRALCDLHSESGTSGKIDEAVRIIVRIAAAMEKVVVFSYLIEPLRLLHTRLTRLGLSGPALLVTGESDADERSAAIQEFVTGKGYSALLASSRVASEGLTLTEANHVIFINEWWNPSSNDQARDRVVRIGQEREVYVYRLFAPNTVEERLVQILREKQCSFDEFVNSLGRHAMEDLIS